MKKKVLNIKENIFIQYTVLFCIFFASIFSVFAIYGKAFLWYSDGIAQHYPSLLYTREWVYTILERLSATNTLSIPFWNLNLGFGQDVFGNAINFRPLNFLYCLFPESAIEEYLIFRVILGMYLTGIAFLCFGKTKQKNKYAVLIGCMIYVFCGFALYFAVRHPFFSEMMFYIPLLLMSVDRILTKKKSALFVIIVFLSGISYFYFLYMITIPAVIYAFFQYFSVRSKKEQGIKDFLGTVLTFAVHYFMGLLLAGFSLIPSIIRTLNSSRISAVTDSNYFHFGFAHYLNFIRSFIDTTEVGIYGYLAFSGIAFFAVLYLIFSRKQNKKLYLGQLIIYTVVFLIPGFTMLFSGFSGITQRWCYIYAFWLAMSVVEVFPLILEKNRSVMIKSIICTALYLLIYTAIVRFQGDAFGSGAIWLFIYMTLIILVNCTNFFEQRKRLFSILLLVLLCSETTLKSYELYSAYGNNYISEYINDGKVAEYGNDNSSTALQYVEDDSIYRTDVVSVPLSNKYRQNNYGLRNGINGLASYYSFSSANITDYSLNLGNSQQNIPFLILDWDQRTVLNELASVKYLTLTDSNILRVPYGYELIAQGNKTYSNGISETEYLYQNKYALPLMYVYDSYIPQSEHDEMETYEKEQAMLQGLVLDAEPDYPKTDVVFDYQVLLNKEDILNQLSLNYQDNDAIEIYDDHFLVKQNNTSILLTVSENMTGEIYWIMDGIKYHSVNLKETELAQLGKDPERYAVQTINQKYRNWEASNTTTVTASIGPYSDTAPLLNNTYQYYFGKKDVLLNLGYCESGNVVLNFSASGEYYFDDLQLICQPMDQYAEKVEKITDTPVTDIRIDGNYILGNMTTDEEKFVCIAVPYSTGWTAYVNGQETMIYPANGMYMAIKTEAGSNEIILVYRTPGLYVGCAVSVAAFAAFVIVFIIVKIKNKRDEKEM